MNFLRFPLAGNAAERGTSLRNIPPADWDGTILLRRTVRALRSDLPSKISPEDRYEHLARMVELYK